MNIDMYISMGEQATDRDATNFRGKVHLCPQASLAATDMNISTVLATPYQVPRKPKTKTNTWRLWQVDEVHVSMEYVSHRMKI
jgi:hypothetical protein